MSDQLPLETEAIQAAISGLPSLSITATALLDSLKSDDIDLDELTRLISTDQTLVARLLRVVNSPFYGMVGKIHGINDAIVVIGLRGVRSLALTVSLSNSLPGLGSPADTKRFWLHSLLVAICARELAGIRRLDTELAFAAGLLHDIGRLVIASGFPLVYSEVMTSARREDAYTFLIERNLLGTDHAEIGALLARKWHFPTSLVEAIGGHHAPTSDSAHTLTRTIHLADAIAHALDLLGDPNERVPELDQHAWQELFAPDTDCDAVFSRIISQFENASDLIT